MRPLLIPLLLGLIGCGPPAWRAARQDGSAGAYEQFARDYDRYDQARTALNRAEALRWRQAEETNKASDWSAYLREHYASNRADEARKRLDDAFYAEAMAHQDSLELERYLAQFPDGAHAKEARGQLDNARWLEAKAEDTHTSYRRYLLQEKDGQHRDKAQDRYEERMWERAARIDNLRSYALYLDEFPNGAHAGDAEARLAQLRFTKVKLAVALGPSAWPNRKEALQLLATEARTALRPILQSNGFEVDGTVATADLGADGALDPSSAVAVPDGTGLVIVVVEDTAGEAYKPRGHAALLTGTVRVYVPAHAGALGEWSVAGKTSERVRSIAESGLYKSAAHALMYDAIGHVGRVRAWHPSPP